MFASLPKLERLSKFVLEVNPMICAAAIGAYVLGSVIAQSSAPTPLQIALPEPIEHSGEEITAMVQTSHAATLAAKAPQQAEPQKAAEAEAPPKGLEPRKAEPKRRGATTERNPPARVAAPKPAPVETAALAPSLPPPPPAVITPVREERSWYGRSWDTVAGWSGDAAGAVVATPGAIVRAGKRTFDVVTDAVIPGR